MLLCPPPPASLLCHLCILGYKWGHWVCPPNPSQKLLTWWKLDFQAFITEVKKCFKQSIPVEDRNGWEKMLATHRQQVNDLTSQITSLEQQINTQIYNLFGLTAEEIAIVEGK